MATSAALNYSEYTVDLWWTDLNDVEFGFFRHARHRAKSRQYTKDSDVIGAVNVNGERKGLLSHRRGAWKDGVGMKKRLVVKLFTEEMNWRGTIDMMLGRSLQLSVGARGLPVLAFSVNLAGHEQIIHVERSALKWPLMPEHYSFFILDDDRQPRFYRLRRDWISIGQDYTLYDQTGERIGHLNGRVIDIGGRWDVKIREDHDETRLNNTLQLFCGMLRYRKACERHVRDLMKAVRRGELKSNIDPQEAHLYYNPRGQRN